MPLLLPAGFVQPFDLRFLPDDLHVMAYFENHPMYEAVEAMVRRTSAGPPIIRAILTRHDQTQIDHVNDPAVFLAANVAQRETCLRPISLHEESAGSSLRARVAFDSHLNEQVVLDITSAGPPDPSRGGLTDPGAHARTSSLPVMLRGKSSLAGAQSRVFIDGTEFAIPVKFRAGPHFVAHHGHFTVSHHMGVLRAGKVSAQLVQAPKRFETGEEWVQRDADGERRYRITAAQPEGDIEIEKTGRFPESVCGRIVEGRLNVKSVRVGGNSGPSSGVALCFDARHFSIAIDKESDLVCGSIESEESADTSDISLLPERPAWAKARAVQLHLVRESDVLSVTTTIGGR